MLGVIVFILLAVIFVSIYYFVGKRTSGVEQSFRRYAQANTIEYWNGIPSSRGMNSLLLTGGLAGYVKNLLIYDDGTEIGEAQVTYAARKPSVLFQFASTPFNKYPDLWLTVDSKLNNILGYSLLDSAKVSTKLTRVELEGSFRDTYKVYMNEGAQIAALTALNPSSMSQLVDFFSRYEVELCSGRVYIYIVSTEEFYQPFFRERMLEDIKKLVAIL